MIKISSGFTGAGGSTVVFNTLVNLFNDNGLAACFYGPYKWNGITCNFKPIEELFLGKDDILIYHFQSLLQRLNCKRQILHCHETDLFKIDRIKGLKFDQAVFVSQFQKDWQAIPNSWIIPNPVRKFTKYCKAGNVAGIIGSIDRNKRTHISIELALRDGFKDIRLYGGLTDYQYFMEFVSPLLSDKVTYRGIATDMDQVYGQLSHVYHSPKLEVFNLVKPECESAGVIYCGEEGNDTKAEYWDDKRILEEWKKLLLF